MHLESDGAYHVFVNKQQWLTNGPTFFRTHGMSYSTSDGSLKRIGEPKAVSGKDTLGLWNGETLLYTADKAQVSVTIRTYGTDDGELAIFTQVFVGVMNLTSLLNLSLIDSGLAIFFWLSITKEYRCVSIATTKPRLLAHSFVCICAYSAE